MVKTEFSALPFVCDVLTRVLYYLSFAVLFVRASFPCCCEHGISRYTGGEVTRKGRRPNDDASPLTPCPGRVTRFASPQFTSRCHGPRPRISRPISRPLHGRYRRLQALPGHYTAVTKQETNISGQKHMFDTDF